MTWGAEALRRTRASFIRAKALAKLLESKLMTLSQEVDEAYLCDLRSAILPELHEIVAESLRTAETAESEYARDLAHIRLAADTLAKLLMRPIDVTASGE